MDQPPSRRDGAGEAPAAEVAAGPKSGGAPDAGPASVPAQPGASPAPVSTASAASVAPEAQPSAVADMVVVAGGFDTVAADGSDADVAAAPPVPGSDVPAAIVRHTRVRPGMEDRYTQWRAEMLTAVRAQPGLLAVEIHPPDAAQDDWVTVERFASTSAARAWLDSPKRQAMLVGSEDFIEGADSVTLIADTANAKGATEVTAVINNRVRAGAEADYRQWLRDIQAAQSHFPGYLGVTVQPPIEGVTEDWVSLLRFDTAEHLRGWLESPQCAQLTQAAQPMLDRAEYRVTSASFRNWLPEAERAAEPAVWKVNAIVLLVLYPVVLLTVVFINPILAPLGVALTVFIGNVIGVAATGFWLVPWAAGKMSRWLSPDPADEPRATRLGTLYVVLAYAGLIAAMTAIALRFA